MSSGIPGGGVLSPLLFACFVTDLPGAIQVDMFADYVKMYGRIDSETPWTSPEPS